MYLKSVTLFGFKSFADKTVLEFQPGVTAIVGPNGCGKSNIADAIRWVLGEQSAKALRGSGMADVIFNGTEKRRPLQVAEVSLTLGGVDRENLKAAGVPIEYDEITITRRVSREGGSTYLLNKTPCRLRDIQQLFAGTGMGRASYSIMAQGNITQILSSRPEDRRMVFEEAAGITLFKARKKEALRKLEQTEQNLLRVEDLIREVKRQIISLQRQAGKARRYQKLMAELQHLETQLARHEYDQLDEALRTRRQRLQEVRAEIDSGRQAVEQGEEELAELRRRHAELEREAGALRQQLAELKAESQRHENRIQFSQQRIVELEQRHTEALSEIDQSRRRHAETEAECATLETELEEAETRCQAALDEESRRRAAVRSVEESLRAAQEELREQGRQLFAVAQDLSRLRNESNALELQKQSRLARLEKLAAEQIQLEEEHRTTRERLAEFERDSEQQVREVEDRRATVQQRQAELAGLQKQAADLNRQLEELQRQQTDRQSRLAVLQQLESGHEGFDEGAQAALKLDAETLGTLAERLRVPDADVPAIEAALGRHLQLILTREPGTARDILRRLAESRQGRASIAALSLDHHGPLPEPPPAVQETLRRLGCRPALEAVRAEPSVDSLVRALLGTTWLAPDLETATAAWQETGGCCEFATPGGELLSRHGVFTGGASGNGKNRAGSILARRNQIEALQQEIASLRQQVEDLSRQRGALQSRITALQASLQEDRSQLQERELALAGRKGECQALQNAVRSLAQKLETVRFEIDTLRDQQQEGEARREQLASSLADLEARHQELQRQIDEGNQAIEGRRQQRDTALAALSEASIQRAKAEEHRTALQQRRAPLQQRLRELAAQIEQRSRQIETALAQREEAAAQIEESRRELARLAAERETGQSRLQTLEQEQSRLETDLADREQALQETRRRLDQLQEEAGRLEVDIAQEQVRLQNLVERIQQKYHLDLAEVPSQAIRIIYADQGPPRVETVSPEEMEAAGASTDWEAVAEQVRALQERLDKMGPVNLVAIEEYEETEQRHRFLSEQHQDLVEAKRQLTELISRINEESRELFARTFEAIRANFRELFTEIFGGGRADLRLIDQDNILESGIDIVARPPGKQLQHLHLLSGGEQTMTAVALLFAIYAVRPSPFCVLDELDAPLDEANINRFIRVLKRFLDRSQFIVITHNKRTIAMADTIYGVTMEERGVSKVVSMKFQQVAESAPSGNGNGNGNGAGQTAPAKPADTSPEGNGNGHGNGSRPAAAPEAPTDQPPSEAVPAEPAPVSAN